MTVVIITLPDANLWKKCLKIGQVITPHSIHVGGILVKVGKNPQDPVQYLPLQAKHYEPTCEGDATTSPSQ